MGIKRLSSFHVTAVKLPIPQRINRFSDSLSLKYSRTVTNALVALPIISPTIRSVAISLTRQETDNTINKTKNEPNVAASTILQLLIGLSGKNDATHPVASTKIATPKLAPELIPNTKGPAIGFLNRVCINKPEIASPAPAMSAVIVRGSLNFQTILLHDSCTSGKPNKALTISEGGMVTDPMAMSRTKKKANKMPRPTNLCICLSGKFLTLRT